jgi:hypothetical protein
MLAAFKGGLEATVFCLLIGILADRGTLSSSSKDDGLSFLFFVLLSF